MATKIVPTFLLKGIRPSDIISDYSKGLFRKREGEVATIQIAKPVAILAPSYGSTSSCAIFSVKDKHNSNIIIATTTHRDFEVYQKNGGDLPEGGRCDFCKEDIEGTCVGYPLGYKENTILCGDPPVYRNTYTFWVEGRFCSFECSLAFVRNVLSRPFRYRDTTFHDSEWMLKFLYRLMHPNKGPLRAAQDPRLLISNGGSLSEEEWKDSRHFYLRTDRVLMVPAKVEYMQQSFVNK